MNQKKSQQNKAFSHHRPNGFSLNFPNGNGLSTIWGIGSHTENHSKIFALPSIDKEGMESYVKAWNSPMSSNDVETMPSCSPAVKKLLDDTFPDNEDGDIFNHLTFDQWLKMVNILNENK